MEITMGSASNLITGVVGYFFQKIKLNFSYVCHHRTMVLDFEKKVEMLKDKRDRVLLDADAAQKNGETIYPDVNNWLMKVDDMIISELNKVKGLDDEAKNKCFIGLCPNFKARYQLSKKAEEDAAAVDELLQQGGFDRVSYRDVPQPIVVVPPKDFEDFDSRKLMFNNIMEAVKDPNLNIIGVYGMPGVGKTMLVKEVVRQVKEDKLFDSVVMAVVTHIPDVQKIQDEIADMLGLKFEEQSISGRASRLRQRLKKEKKILVVLDDIWAKLDLMEVGIPLGDEDQVQGCTILLTSRDLNVLLKGMDAKRSFPIGVLEHEEAWHFFKKITGDGVESSDLLPIATEVAKKCGGLPIAIRTLSTFLRNEPSFVWEDALRQLSKPSSSNFEGVPATVYSTIEWSYDRLQSKDHKQTFLLCSLMGHNACLDLLLVFAMGLGLFHGVSTIKETRNKLLTVVSHLKASCLLLDGNTNMQFDMHDLISDVAMSIASKGNPVFVLRSKHDLNDWPDDETMKECDKISCFGVSELPDQLKCPKLTFMGMVNKDPWMKIPTNFFKETKNLKVLFLAGMNLPSSISLLGSLRALCLNKCALGDIALIGELKNLEILIIANSDIEMLPKEIGQLTKLKRLDLGGCSKLKRIPPGVLCNLSRLEELYLDDSLDEWGAEGHSSQESNSSLAELEALPCLTALEIRIPNAKIIPKDFSFEKLQRYIIFIGEASHWDWKWGWVREYSRTLKLNLQTSISLLNNEVKVLLKKAENLYINEVKGVEILLRESEVGNYFQQLKNLHIQNGEKVQYILKDSDDVQKIEFLQLESLTLQGLPNLISFCSKKEGSTSISPQEIALFKQKILFPKLEKLKLSSISIGRIWSPQAFCSTQNLTSLIIKGCANLKHVLSDSMPEYLQHLKCLEISECKCIQEIISSDKMIQETFKSRALIRFPRLNLLKLKGLQKLIGFCHEDHTVEFPVLMILEIENCPELKGFIHNSTNKDIPTHGVLFNNKGAFPNLEKITISHLKKAKRIWYNQLHTNSFSMLKELTIKECDVLLNIFPPFSLGVFQRLEKLIVSDCASLKQVFQVQGQGLDIEETYVVHNQLRELNLFRLPKLKHVWTKYHKRNISFGNLRRLCIEECWSLKTLFPFSIAKDLQQLERLTIYKCGLEEIVAKSVKESDKQDVCFAFNQLSFLELWRPPYLTCFYQGMHRTTWPALKQLKIYGCGSMKIFGPEESQIRHSLFLLEKVIPQLEEVSFSLGDIAMISDGQFEAGLFCKIKFLRIFGDFGVSVFPISFLSRFYNLESLQLGFCYFKELASFESDAFEDKDRIITISKIKKLRLDRINNIRHLWKKDSPLDHICASLECLEVWRCNNLINLGLDISSFENLTTLDVWKCNKMSELITSFKPQSLVCLVTMRISECEMMREVVASDGDETSYEIIFKALKHLELHFLQSLTSFCSGNYTLRFPSLEQVTLSQCPRMKNFYRGALSTPKLHKVQLTETNFKGRWVGDLNATVEQLYKEQVGYRGLKHLKLSEFPELVDIWSKNPQEMLDFTTLKYLEVFDSKNLRYIFNLSMAFGLGQLQKMDIKRCGKLEQVIKEQDSISLLEEATADGSNIISIFPRLQSIIVESCPNMTSFYLGSRGLEFLSLIEIKIAGCSNMITFVSTFSREKDEETIIGDEVDNDSTFFSDKVAFPNLERITISHLRNAKWIWYNQLHTNSFSMLKELIVKECDVLLNIFPPLLLRVFQRLEKLIVTDCASLKQVFQLQVQGLDIEETYVVHSQLKEVNLFRLPKLKHVWTKYCKRNISFGNLRQVCIKECWSLKTLFPFSIAKDLQQLERLTIDKCGLEEIVAKSVEESDKQEICFAFNQLSFLELWRLPYLTCFYQGMHRTTWPALKQLTILRCGRIKIFGHEESQKRHSLFLVEKVLPQLEEVSLSHGDIAMISDGQFEADLFCNIKLLQIYCNFGIYVFPISFLSRFHNLESLELRFCYFKELASFESDAFEDKDMIITIPKIKKLILGGINNIRHLWKQDSPLDHICASLECLEVLQCDNLINLGLDLSSFENLTTLDVWKCNKMSELITSFKPQSLVCLVTMRIRECEMMKEVIASDGDDTSYEIIFKALKRLELYFLQSLTSFCSGNYTLRFPSLEQVILGQCPRMKNFYQGGLSTPKLHKVQLTETDFKGRWVGDLNATVEQLYKEHMFVQILFPKLEKLTLSSIGIERIWLPQAFCATQNLTSLIIQGCAKIKYVVSDSMIKYLQQLKCLEVSECKCIHEIILMEETIKEAFENRALIYFPRLNSLKLKDLQKLIEFCREDYIVKFPALKILEIENCPELKEFVHKSIDKDIHTDGVLFNEKVVFPNLEKITISHLRNVKRIWYNQLHTNSFSMLKELTIKESDALLNIFSPFLLRVFQKLEKLTIIDCVSLEEVFQLPCQGLDTEETFVVIYQLRQVELFRLPKLKHVWNNDPKENISFKNLRVINVWQCMSLKSLFPFSIARDLRQLETLIVDGCGMEEIVSKNVERAEEQEIWFEFNQLSYLSLWNLPNLICFYSGKHDTAWHALKRLKTYWCLKIKIFGHLESQIQPLFLIQKVVPQLEEVSFSSDDIEMISDGQFDLDLFCNIKFLHITSYFDESSIFPIRFIQRFYNLESLALCSCNFRELSSSESDACEHKDKIIMLPKIKKLKLYLVNNIRHLWKQDSLLDHICASLECLEVWRCGTLINLGLNLSFFENLTTLDVWKCKEMSELITSSKAQSLVCLVTMRIRECEMMRQVVAREGDETSYEIVFRELKCLELHCLQSLTSFCSGNQIFSFPSLEQVILSQCPRMKNFYEGVLSTPKLLKVQVTKTDFTGRWAGDLNATVDQLYKEQNVELSEEKHEDSL
ncbi:hypothetical protein J1N35_024060 [Gossypium stocksii]|uniref:AAA+ ATPase domain-containing protein n=1 Tax=Gossypium stocksii TaxID=47602 RepID=A0A9D3VKR9_9ROSI|nr:hypothetical protein J1N35_024060 [Gossypium stocksii]